MYLRHLFNFDIRIIIFFSIQFTRQRIIVIYRIAIVAILPNTVHLFLLSLLNTLDRSLAGYKTLIGWSFPLPITAPTSAKTNPQNDENSIKHSGDVIILGFSFGKKLPTHGTILVLYNY